MVTPAPRTAGGQKHPLAWCGFAAGSKQANYLHERTRLAVKLVCFIFKHFSSMNTFQNSVMELFQLQANILLNQKWIVTLLNPNSLFYFVFKLTGSSVWSLSNNAKLVPVSRIASASILLPNDSYVIIPIRNVCLIFYSLF